MGLFNGMGLGGLLPSASFTESLVADDIARRAAIGAFGVPIRYAYPHAPLIFTRAPVDTPAHAQAGTTMDITWKGYISST